MLRSSTEAPDHSGSAQGQAPTFFGFGAFAEVQGQGKLRGLRGLGGRGVRGLGGLGLGGWVGILGGF